MGLIGNKFRNATGCHRAIGDTQAMHQSPNRSNWSYFKTQEGAATVLRDAAFPVGLTTAAWFSPQQVGEMSLRVAGAGAVAGTLVATRPMALDLTGAGDLAAIGALSVAMDLALTGSGSMTASIEGRLNASVDLSGSGGLAATIEGLGNMVVALLGQGSVSATIAAYGNMEIDIVVTGTGLTNESIAAAVWDRLAALHPDLNTMGGKLSSAEKAAKLAAALSA